MTYEAVLADTIEIISSISKKSVNENTNLAADLDMDSIAIAELVAEIEDRFKVIIPMERLPELRTTRDVVVNLLPLLNASNDLENVE